MYHSEPLEAATYVLSELARVRDIDRQNQQLDLDEKQKHIADLKLTTRVRRLSEDYGAALEGTAEGRYLEEVRGEYQTEPRIWSPGVLDTDASFLRLRGALTHRLHGTCIGSLIRRAKTFSKKEADREVEDKLNALGLGYNMKIGYAPPCPLERGLSPRWEHLRSLVEAFESEANAGYEVSVSSSSG